jgi:hypothetical protein
MHIINIRWGFLATYTLATDNFHSRQMVSEWIGLGGKGKILAQCVPETENKIIWLVIVLI